MISIICCYNNENTYQNMLLQTLEKQTVEYELIRIDNRKKRFKSAAEALNWGAKQSVGEILIFVHQDICFQDENSLKYIVSVFEKIARMGDIVGIAGAVRDARSELGARCVWGEQFALDDTTGTSNGFKEDFAEAESIDECMIIMQKSTWENHPFDEKICNCWHFYGVEACMNALVNHHKVYVINGNIKHGSKKGKCDSDFYKTRWRLAKKYKEKFPYIVSTCTFCYTNPTWKLYVEWLNYCYANSLRKYRESLKLKIKKRREK